MQEKDGKNAKTDIIRQNERSGGDVILQHADC